MSHNPPAGEGLLAEEQRRRLRRGQAPEEGGLLAFFAGNTQALATFPEGLTGDAQFFGQFGFSHRGFVFENEVDEVIIKRQIPLISIRRIVRLVRVTGINEVVTHGFTEVTVS